MKLVQLLTSTIMASLAACATQGSPDAVAKTPAYSTIHNPYFAGISTMETSVAKDRAAILAMRGEYQVDFHFQETVPLKAGYELHEEKNTGGYETVLVVDEEPNRIVLQHILVTENGIVVKHWRQDWYYEAIKRFEFVADQTWEIRAIDKDRVTGMWTQCVFEVSDAPRYCGTGQWNHKYGVSTWTGDRTWRPLPRREYTKRSDYNAINAENRHTITPNGWTHEQDNTKTVRSGKTTSEVLVREFGFNDYKSIEGYNFSPAKNYWIRTSKYWAKVRAAWNRRLGTYEVLNINTDVDGMPIIEGIFEQAEGISGALNAKQVESIEALLSKWTEVR